jgi:tRNA nucleotidyltransferase/poly(A) polymerase
MLAHAYARHIPAHARVGKFVADEPRMRFAFHLLRDVPQADVFVTGGTARDAVLGRVPHGIHLTVHGVPESELTEWRKSRNVARDLDIKIPASNLPHPAAHTLPIVHDLARRDATVNAMAYSVRDGLLHDPFDGLKDIDEKKLRTIGNPTERFHEDPLRMVRFVRLASQLGFSIEDQTLHAIRKLGRTVHRLTSHTDGRARFVIPRAHLGRELMTSLTHAPGETVKHFFSSGLMSHLSPELHKLEQMVSENGQALHEHAETILHDLRDHEAGAGVTLATLLALLEDESTQAFEKTTERLHLPLLENGAALMGTVTHLLKNQHILLSDDPGSMSPATFEKVFGGKRGDDLLLFLHALTVAGGHDSMTRERWYAAKHRKEQMGSVQEPDLVRGRDLLSLGFAPGAHLRQLMSKIRDEQLGGRIHTKTEALEFARSLI